MRINVIIPVTWPGRTAVIMTANSFKGFVRNLKPANNLFVEPRTGWVAKRRTFLGTFLDIKSSYDNLGKIALEYRSRQEPIIDRLLVPYYILIMKIFGYIL